jgi:putative transposon-encoded protein
MLLHMSDPYDVTVRRGGFVQEFKGYEVIEKEVANGGNSGRVFVPKKWVGKHVKIVLMEPVGEEPTD